jgi:hypothetical protein
VTAVSAWQYYLFVELFIEEQEQGNEDMVEQPHVAFIKLLTQMIRGIPNQHTHEERYNIKAD